MRQFTALVTSASLEGRKQGDIPQQDPPATPPGPCPQPRTQTGGEMGRNSPAGPGAGEPHARAASRSGCSPVAVVVEVVVTGQSQKDAESGAQGEENLRSSIHPDLAGETTRGLEARQGPHDPMLHPPHSARMGPCCQASLVPVAPSPAPSLGVPRSEAAAFPWDPQSHRMRQRHRRFPKSQGEMKLGEPPSPPCPVQAASAPAAQP